MFTLGFREGLEAALIVALLASLVRGTAELRRLWWICIGAVVLSATLVVTVRRVQLELTDTVLHGVKAIVAVGAVAVLTSTVRWSVAVLGRVPGDLPPIRSGTIGSVAFLAIVREGVELAVFPGAGPDARWGPATPAMALGVVAAAMIGACVYAAFRSSPARLVTIAAVVLLLIAAGLLAAAVRSAQIALGWRAAPLFETPLSQLPATAQTLVKGLFGVHASPTPTEVIVYVAYVVAVGAIAARAWRRREAAVATVHHEPLPTAGGRR